MHHIQSSQICAIRQTQIMQQKFELETNNSQEWENEVYNIIGFGPNWLTKKEVTADFRAVCRPRVFLT